MAKKGSNRRIEIQELKQLQIGVLNAVHSFCKTHHIRYSLACGTMLGAVRHKGYIPWDDDIDIYLLRDDYDKLIKLFPVVYLDHYELFSLERNKYWSRPYAKAFDNRTVLYENSSDSISIGVNIDIYPIDDVPDNLHTWNRYNSIRRILQKLFLVKIIRLEKRRSFWKNSMMLFVKFFLSFIDKRHFACLLSRYAQLNNGKGYHNVFECVQGMLQKNRFSKYLFEELCEYSFENKQFLGFKNYDEYLKNGYGDYWNLPPIEKRVTHHFFDAYWINDSN